MMRIRRENKGFTLIELMVVILIIAMLGTFVAPNVMNKLSPGQVGPGQAPDGGDRERLEEFRVRLRPAAG